MRRREGGDDYNRKGCWHVNVEGSPEATFCERGRHGAPNLGNSGDSLGGSGGTGISDDLAGGGYCVRKKMFPGNMLIFACSTTLTRSTILG